jgi:photosystem II stability/assembly factor-like uncharacterized protein
MIGTHRRLILRFGSLAVAGALAFAPGWAEAGAAQQATGPSVEDLGDLNWRNVGPNRGGRSISVTGTATRPLEYYFGATGGGVWKTTDAGNTWNPVGDGQFNTSSVGVVAQCEADPDVVWAGMGEVELRGNVIPGDGVYKSTDAGETWTHMGLASSTGQQMISRIRIDPGNCDRVFVAALGDPFGSNEERGVYRSDDGGASWSHVLFNGEDAGAVDLMMDPSDPNTLFAGFWDVQRTPWKLDSGGPGSGLFRSTDGGESWDKLNDRDGLPTTMWGKVGVSVSGADSNRVYAIIESDEGGVFRSDDRGESWDKVSVDRNLRQRAFYYTRIYADPVDRETVYVMNVQFWRSNDGGSEWSSVGVPHGDNHDLWIAPNDNQRMANSNDGGANVSWNAGMSWTGQPFPTAQMYDVRVTNHFPYHICGGQQDNSTACVPMDGDGSYFYAAGGCETGPVTPHPADVDLFYAACYGGSMSFLSRVTGQNRAVNVWPVNPMGNSAIDLKERFQWNHPITASQHDPSIVYVGSQHVWRSDNAGQSWERLSDDLTYAEPETLGPSGGDITRDQTSVEYYGTVWRITESPLDPNEVWTGSDDGKVHVTRDGGVSWNDVTPYDMLPKFSRVHEIDVSPHEPGKVYVTAVRYRMQDVNPYVFKTEDWGETWQPIVEGIPAGSYPRSVREDLVQPGLLYAGTETGMLVSMDDGESWESLQLNLPTVQVPGVVLRDDDVIIATHGRSYWVLDNITPLRQVAAMQQGDLPGLGGSAPSAILFKPADAIRTLSRPVESYRRTKRFAPEFDYWLSEEAERVQLEVLDAEGNVIRTYASDAEDRSDRGGLSNQPGHHRVMWDMRYPGPRDFEGLIFWAANTQGPLAPPGDYQVRLTVGGDVQTQSFRINKDPRLTDVTQADFDAQFELASQIAARVDDAHRAIVQIRDVRAQVEDRLEGVDAGEVVEFAETFKGGIGEVEGEIYQVRLEARQDPLNFPIRLNNQIAALRGVVESADARPTDQSAEAFQVLSNALEGELTQLNVLFTEDLDRLNEMLEEMGKDPIVVPELERRIVF